MKLLILGGNGYLGSKVVQTLDTQGGHFLVCTKRYSSNIASLEPFLTHGAIRMIPASLDAVS